ncbi:MAG: NEAT domain-containing protein [Hydrogeniiclostridium mannosilyticum]
MDKQIGDIQKFIDALVLKDTGDWDINNLPDGKYTLYAQMIKTDRENFSMSNEAINHNVWLEVIDGEYYLTMQFKGLTIENKFGYLMNLSYYDAGYTYNDYGIPQGTLIPTEVLSTQKNADGTDVIDQYNDADHLYPEMIRLKLVDKAAGDYVPLQVFVPIMEAISDGTGTQDVLMKLDWSLLKLDDGEIKPEEPVEQSPAVDYTDAKTGVKVHADKGVFEEGVQIVVSEITKGADYDAAVSSLSNVGKKFKLYDVKFLDADGNEVAPNGTVSISFPITAGYDSANVAAYRLSDGSKILVKGTVENGYYTVITKTAGSYALVEKGSTITDAQNNQNQGNTNTPQTGDTSNVGAVALLALAAAGMMGVTVITKKRKSEES